MQAYRCSLQNLVHLLIKTIMEYIPKKVKIQHLRSGKISEITKVAWDVMVKHRMNKGYEIINPSMPVQEITEKKVKAKKVEIPSVTIINEEPIQPEEPKTENQNPDSE